MPLQSAGSNYSRAPGIKNTRTTSSPYRTPLFILHGARQGMGQLFCDPGCTTEGVELHLQVAERLGVGLRAA